MKLQLKQNLYPGIPTDIQAQIMVFLSLMKGKFIIQESIFENRFMHVKELKKMGADITVDQDIAVIQGINELQGEEIYATDLRASMSLILAGLVAKGTTTINNISYVDRGYEKIVEKLSDCGASIMRIKLSSY